MNTENNKIDISNMVGYLLKNYKKFDIGYSDSGRTLDINNIKIQKILLTRLDHRDITDYVTETDESGEIFTYNCFAVNDSHVSIYDDAWNKIVKLDKLCRAKYRRNKRWKNIKDPLFAIMGVIGGVCLILWLMGKDIEKREEVKTAREKQRQIEREQIRKQILQEYGLDTCLYDKTR